MPDVTASHIANTYSHKIHTFALHLCETTVIQYSNVTHGCTLGFCVWKVLPIDLSRKILLRQECISKACDKVLSQFDLNVMLSD